MKGLEITIFNKNEILKDNVEFRIDSEYYKKEFLKLYSFIDDSPKLGELTYMSDLSTNGSFAVVAKIKNDNNPKVVPFIRSGNVGETFINKSELEFISQEAHNQLPKSTTELHEVMMARKGKIGGASIITEEETNFNCSENVIKLKILDKNRINPFYFTAYFNSKYGLKQIERLSTGNVQPWVSIFQIKKLMIPILNFNFQEKIAELIKIAHTEKKRSENSFKTAENLLNEAIGLKDFELNDEPINIKKFSESFGLYNRIDSEFYQPFYDDVEKIIKSHGFSLLSEICSDINYGTVPTSPYTNDSSGVPYIKGLNIKNTEISKEKLDRIINTEELQEKFYTKKGDIIISQMGTVGDVGVVREEEDWLFASFTIRARLSEPCQFNPIFIGLYIQKIAKPYYLYRNIAQASVRQNTDLPTVRNLFVPHLDQSIQDNISMMVENSFAQKNRCENFLFTASKAIELAIEQDEEYALKFIQKELFSEEALNI
ncbi:MAG TPA: restriction endonuclease subunit S [Salegentibacter sp.]|uniref:restriction endonuclease subunit S n=1 Tax=Salegentibacter sp. TaxID=1903072 RepID=UPI002F92F0C6